MVPGFTERQRLTVEAQRQEWLKEARDGPSRFFCLAGSPASNTGSHTEALLAFWRRTGSALRASSGRDQPRREPALGL
jgi:hypothetical protein